MKKIIDLIYGFLMALVSNAQIVNLNPDPNGEPWWAGDLPVITPEIQARLDSIPVLELSQISANTPLPDVVDNSTLKYMRPIFSQDDGSCSQASGIAYTYTFEINRLRGLSANNDSLIENLYPTHYTYNFINNGYSMFGSLCDEGWRILMENGCPNVEKYGGLSISGLDSSGRWAVWISDYLKYYSGMFNRVKSYYQIDATTQDGYDKIKHWLNDHNEGDTIGGLICFLTYMGGGTSYDELPPESDDAGKKIMKSIGHSSGHAMTIVGYNDNIKYDFNGNSIFENDEFGALKIANSWGNS